MPLFYTNLVSAKHLTLLEEEGRHYTTSITLQQILTLDKMKSDHLHTETILFMCVLVFLPSTVFNVFSRY